MQRAVQGAFICVACGQGNRGRSPAVAICVMKWCLETHLSTRAGDEEHLVVRERHGRDAKRAARLHRKSLCNPPLQE